MNAASFQGSGTAALLGVFLAVPLSAAAYRTLPDTDQSLCFDTAAVVEEPLQGEPFYGQDAQYQGLQPAYQDNGDGTVTDLNTGLMWQQELPPGKMTWEEAMAGADTCGTGGYDDWRLPSVRELYSLIQFSGTDPSGPDPHNPIPFIDTDYFEFQYGDTLAGERLIDAQYWSSTVYQGLTMNGDSTAFGVNFADGRIKGYPRAEAGPPGRGFIMTSFVRYVRGDAYGQNQFVDNGDGTVTDTSTGLMWQQSDDGTARNWEDALAFAEDLELAGYDDWRLPDARELQSIVDYNRSMQSTGSPAIDPVFSCTQITDEGGGPNYGFYWTGTTHQGTIPGEEGRFAVYIAFGEALGWMTAPDSTWVLQDVHGAGAQRSDPKTGDPSQYPHGHGPQGDVIRIFNFVRSVRSTGTGLEQEGGGGSPSITLQVAGPNPFSGTTALVYSVGSACHADISVYDTGGRKVAVLLDEFISAGAGTVQWDPSGLPCGTYICLLDAEREQESRKLLLIP